jgi:hypothetical protein
MAEKPTVSVVQDPVKDALVIDFNDAKQPHVLQRKEDRVQAMRQAFKAVREANQPSKKPAAKNAKTRKKDRKKE